MNTITIQAKITTLVPSAGGAVAPADAPPSLLPDVGSPTRIDVSDALAEILKISSALSDAQTKGAQSSVLSADHRRKEASQKRMDAINKAIEAARKAAEEKSSGGLFGFIEDKLGVAGIIGIAVLTVASSGALGATALLGEAGSLGAGTLAAETSAVELTGIDFASHLTNPEGSTNLLDGAAILGGPLAFAADQIFEKIDPGEVRESVDKLGKLSDDDIKVAKRIALTVLMAEIAATTTIATAGTGTAGTIALIGVGISTSTQVLQQTGALKAMFGDKAEWVALGGTLVGAGVSLGASVVSLVKGSATTANLVADALSGGKAVAEGAFDVSQGLRNLRAADDEHDADNFKIEAQRQKHVLEFVERFVEGVLDDLRNVKDSAQRTTSCVQQAMQTQNQTMLMAASLKV